MYLKTRLPATQRLALIYDNEFRGTNGRLLQRDGVRLHYARTEQTQWQQSFQVWWFDLAFIKDKRDTEFLLPHKYLEIFVTLLSKTA
ncbi:MAG: hypothetical protein ABW139_06910 [Candidatus Thiodiazotropha sp. DIVDIV]